MLREVVELMAAWVYCLFLVLFWLSCAPACAQEAPLKGPIEESVPIRSTSSTDLPNFQGTPTPGVGLPVLKKYMGEKRDLGYYILPTLIPNHTKTIEVKTRMFLYQDDKGQTLAFPKKIKGVPDGRTWYQKHPRIHQVSRQCRRVLPIAQLGATLGSYFQN